MSLRGTSPPPVYDSTGYSHTTLKPYLELPHLLSLTWLAYPILSLLFVAFRLQLSISSAEGSVAGAKADLISSCTAAQTAATSVASMPRYLAVAANHQITNAVNDTLDAARDALILALTIMEGIINFIVDMYRSTFLCFLELVVRGALSILIGFVQEADSFLSSTFSSIRTSIQNDVSSANSAITSVINEINKVNPFGNISVPTISIPSLTSLENVTLPSDIETALVNLNNSLPTLSTLKSELDAIIDTPFELVIKEINETFSNFTFNVNALPVPEQNTLSFCGDLDTSVVDDLAEDLVKVATIGTVILIALALLLLGANCALEWYKWRLLKRHLQRTRDAWTSDPSVHYAGASKAAPVVDMSDHNLLLLQADSLHPHLMKIANAISRLCHLNPSQYINLRWFLHYVFHPPALACFLIGFFGLLSVEIQVIAVRPLADKYSQAAVESAQGYADLIATSVNSSMYNQSSVYADQVNAQVDIVQNAINDGLFGWVNGTTTTLNNTLNAFYNDIQNAVSTVFNGTILESPIQEFVRCFIGGKIDDIEDALTFLHNNLAINVPRVNESALVLSPSDLNEMTTPIATAAVGGGSSNPNGVIGDLVDDYIASLQKERIMFGVFMGLWGVVVLMALAIIFWHSYGRGWLETYRRRKWQRQQRAGIDGIIMPFRPDQPAPRDAEKMERGEKEGQVTLPTFTPMPSPFPKHGVLETFRASVKRFSRAPERSNPLHPAFNNSWDDILDQSQQAEAVHPSEAHSGYQISHPMRLSPNRAREDLQDETSSEQRHTWFPRMVSMIWKKDQPEEVVERTPRGRLRPQLTITTASETTLHGENLPEVDHGATGGPNVPGSAWSVSPGPPPHKLPWFRNSMAPNKKAGLPPHPSPHFKRRRAPPVPSDVESVYSPPPPQLSPPLPQVPAPLPLHHGFSSPTRPAEQRPRNLLPPPMHPTRMPTKQVFQAPQAADPFVTPFDDEHRVQSSMVSTDPFAVRRSVPTNPFIATGMAL